jgi:Flp pilus assembly protein TadG
MRASRPRNRRGVAAVEFAVVSPFLILLVFGIIECGRAIMVQQVLTNASREGTRRAVLEEVTTSEVTTVVSDYLANGSITGATVTVSPTPLTSAGFGDPVTVTVSVPYDQVSWIPPWFMGGRTLSASTQMHADRLE